MGVERMTIAGRLGPSDLANARANIRAFVQLMKSEAVFLGQPDRLDKETLRAAHRRLERKGLLTTFTLWPFWPNEICRTRLSGKLKSRLTYIHRIAIYI